MNDDDLDPVVERRFDGLDNLRPPDSWPGIRGQRERPPVRGRRLLAAAVGAACLALVGIWASWPKGENDGVVAGPGPTTSTPDQPAPTSSVEPVAATGTLRVSEFQVECCYAEGSTGVMEIRTLDGDLLGPVVESGSSTIVPNDLGGNGFVSAFPDTTLAPGRYEISVWQLDWPFTIDDIDRAEQLDLCTAEVTIGPSVVVELVATWSPGVGCISFTPPTLADVPAVDIECGGADLATLSGVHAADNDLLGPDGAQALQALADIDSKFVNSLQWSTVRFGGRDRVLFGSTSDAHAGGPYLGYATFESGQPVDWGVCDLSVTAAGFELVPVLFDSAPVDEQSRTLLVQVCAEAIDAGRRVVPVVVESPHFIGLGVLVEDLLPECATSTQLVDVEIVLGLPWQQRPLVDWATPGGVVRRPADPVRESVETLLASMFAQIGTNYEGACATGAGGESAFCSTPTGEADADGVLFEILLTDDWKVSGGSTATDDASFVVVMEKDDGWHYVESAEVGFPIGVEGRITMSYDGLGIGASHGTSAVEAMSALVDVLGDPTSDESSADEICGAQRLVAWEGLSVIFRGVAGVDAVLTGYRATSPLPPEVGSFTELGSNIIDLEGQYLPDQIVAADQEESAGEGMVIRLVNPFYPGESITVFADDDDRIDVIQAGQWCEA